MDVHPIDVRSDSAVSARLRERFTPSPFTIMPINIYVIYKNVYINVLAGYPGTIFRYPVIGIAYAPDNVWQSWTA